MGIVEVPVTSKGQITIPIEYRKALKLDENPRILIIPMHPGEIRIVAAPKKAEKGFLADIFAGKYVDDSWDSLEELKKYKAEDLELEKRGITQ
jgi:bifunctional DNA-binding transcriptional regulator/antitoxin component of YhaV-PrlF toxin-antitoxin module